jgi:hypothetical protein
LGFGSPSEFNRTTRGRSHHARKREATAPSHEVCRPYSVSPAWAAARWNGDASPDPHTPSGFLNLLTFRAAPWPCRSYFIPNPLMGYSLQGFLSSRAAVRRFRRRYPHAVGQPSKSTRRKRFAVAPPKRAPATRGRDVRLEEHPSTSGFFSARKSATVDGWFRPEQSA